MLDEVAFWQRRLDPGVEAVVLQIASSRMVWREAARHTLPRGALELVALPLDALDDAVERTPATVVDHCRAVALKQLRIGEIQTNRERHALRREVEPVAG